MDVSVVIPTRNRCALFTMTLASVLRQQDIDFEVIVVDEASRDETPAVLAAIRDPRVRVIRHDTPRGLPGARNHGAAESRAEWLAFVDDDDLWAPDKLVRQLDAAGQAGCDWAYTGAVNIEGQRIVHSRRPLPPDQVVAALPRYNPIPGGGSNVALRRKLWKTTGLFESGFRSGGEDWELSIRLAKQSPPAWVCRPLIAKRVHPSNMSLDVAEIVRATRLIESLHGISVDWGRVHRWIAERHLRTGRRGAAMMHFVRAALLGQRREVLSDLNTILRRRVARTPANTQSHEGGFDREWADLAVPWLRDFGCSVQ